MKKSAASGLFNSSLLDKAFLRIARNDADVHDALMPFLKEAAKWEHLPKGWTQDSVKKFWDSLTGEVKHKVTKCMKEMEGKVDNTGAFCAALADVVDPGWRSRRAQIEEFLMNPEYASAECIEAVEKAMAPYMVEVPADELWAKLQQKMSLTKQAKKNDSVQWKPYTGRPLQLSTKEIQRADEQWTVTVRPQPNGKWMVAVVRVEGAKGYPWGPVAYVSDQKDISEITQQQLRMVSKMSQGGNMADSSRLRHKARDIEETWGPLLKESSGISNQIKDLDKKFGWNTPDRSSAILDWWWLSGGQVNRTGESLAVSKKKPDEPEGYYDNPAQSGHVSYLKAPSASRMFTRHKTPFAITEMLALIRAGVIIGPQTLKMIEELLKAEQISMPEAKKNLWDAIWADASSGKLFSPKFTYKWLYDVRNWSLD